MMMHLAIEARLIVMELNQRGFIIGISVPVETGAVHHYRVPGKDVLLTWACAVEEPPSLPTSLKLRRTRKLWRLNRGFGFFGEAGVEEVELVVTIMFH